MNNEAVEPDRAEIIRALREYRAAENALSRAWKEFDDVLPSGYIVLHQAPDRPGFCWSYEKKEDNGWHEGGHRNTETFGKPTIVIEAPGPKEEILPRLLGER